MRRIFASLLLTLGTAACGDDLPDQYAPNGSSTGCGTAGCTGATTTGEATTGAAPGSTSGTGPGGSSSSDDGPATVGIPDECEVSSDCGTDQYCVAPFVPEYGPEGKGPNECVAECVVIMDELRWCLDADACCDPDAVCTDRGYCVYPDDGTGSGGSSDGGSSDGDTGTGTTG